MHPKRQTMFPAALPSQTPKQLNQRPTVISVDDSNIRSMLQDPLIQNDLHKTQTRVKLSDAIAEMSEWSEWQGHRGREHSEKRGTDQLGSQSCDQVFHVSAHSRESIGLCS